MGTDSKDEQTHSDHAIAGAISGFVTRFLCQPLDVLKIRFQLQVEPIAYHNVSKYHSLLQAFILILKEESLFALWKGHVPAQLLSIVYGMSQFYSYSIFTETLKRLTFLDEWNYATKFIAGAGAGTLATVVSFPFDTVRTRLVAQSRNHQVYRGLCHSCSSIFYESPRTFFFGLLPTLLQVAPHTGLQFLFYNFISDMHAKYFQQEDTTFSNSMVAGSAAGLLAKTIVYPFDLSRKRLQIQGFEHGRKGFGKYFKCRGLLDCLRLTVKEEGFTGLFKGLVPSQIKASVTTALHFTAYEQSLILLKAIH